MKKLLIVLLCLCLALPTAVFAGDKAIIGFGKAQKQDNTAVLPVYISHIPDGFAGVSALTYIFTYDNALVEFKGAKAGTIADIGGWVNQPDESVGKVVVSWFDSSRTETESKAITAEKAGIDNPMFYVEFEILDTTAQRAFVNIERAVITDINMNTSTNADLSTIAGVINISAEISGGETEDDGSSDNENGDDSTGSGDNSGSDDEGTTGGDTDADGNDDNSTGGDSGSDDDDSSTGGNNSAAGGIIKPSTGSNNNSSGGSSSGSKPSSTGSASTGSSSISGVTSGVTNGAATTTEKKASDIFSDVSDSHWAAASAVRLNQLGIVAGDDLGRANLDNKITRAETSKLALLINGIEVKTGIALDVTDSADVPEWARDYMATAVAQGIFKGYEDGSIKPVNNITRAEMVSVIISSLGIAADDNAQASFADMGSEHWAAKLVAKAVELGFVNGYEDNTFKPGNPITRAEAFAIFARVADYLEK